MGPGSDLRATLLMCGLLVLVHGCLDFWIAIWTSKAALSFLVSLRSLALSVSPPSPPSCSSQVPFPGAKLSSSELLNGSIVPFTGYLATATVCLGVTRAMRLEQLLLIESG